jgi:hypothetical protein
MHEETLCTPVRNITFQACFILSYVAFGLVWLGMVVLVSVKKC